MRKTLRSLLTAGTIGLASLMPAKKAEAQVAGNIEYIQSEKKENSFGRLNMFYSLPEKANGFSFIEFYRNGGGYFGKTILNRPIKAGLGPKVEAVYSGEPLSRVGLGVGFSVPKVPNGGYANLGLVPVWISSDQKRVQAQYAFGLNLPKGFHFNGFGEWNLSAENGPEWGYGETELTKDIGPLEFGYNMRLYNDGNASPKHQHGLILTLNLRGKK